MENTEKKIIALKELVIELKDNIRNLQKENEANPRYDYSSSYSGFLRGELCILELLENSYFLETSNSTK